jgi:Cft2 family RNA processing exonuclease
MAVLPFFDDIEPEEIDLLLITHFHLDPAASLPYFTEHTGFTGRIFMTHPTKVLLPVFYCELSNAILRVLHFYVPSRDFAPSSHAFSDCCVRHRCAGCDADAASGLHQAGQCVDRGCAVLR